MRYRNKYDFSGKCSEVGETAEDLFQKIAWDKGWSARSATRKEQLQHIDFHLYNDESLKEYKVDVKARKKVKRTDSNINDELIWVEFTNVAGREGWLNGLADYIAFEQEDHFIIFDRLGILNFCKKKVNFKNRVTQSKDAVYNIYQRSGRKDEISLIPLNDLKKHLGYSTWPK